MDINKDIFKDYWYRQKVVQYEITKLAQYREMVFLDKAQERLPVRCLFVYRVEHLVQAIDAFNFLPFYSYNIYLSVALFRNPPPFSFLPKIRREEMDKWSGRGCEPQYKEHLIGYDMFFDFDSPNELDVKPALLDALKMKASLDKHKCPYVICFSGQKGLHIRIPYKVLPQNLGWNIVEFCKRIGEMCHAKMSLSTLDIGVFDDRRIYKAPYSFDRGNICLPLDDAQLLDFNILEMKAVNVFNNIKIFNRGDLMRHNEQTTEQQRSNFLAWFRELRG